MSQARGPIRRIMDEERRMRRGTIYHSDDTVRTERRTAKPRKDNALPHINSWSLGQGHLYEPYILDQFPDGSDDEDEPIVLPVDFK
jgi:hypothetical protein